jgi:hypothetical protein
MPYQSKAGLGEIPLPFSKQNLRKVIRDIIINNSSYSHEALVEWCSQLSDHILWNELDSHLEEIGIDEITFEVINDIEGQWDSFLVDEYDADEFYSIDLSKVQLPEKWLKDWYIRLSNY